MERAKSYGYVKISRDGAGCYDMRKRCSCESERGCVLKIVTGVLPVIYTLPLPHPRTIGLRGP